MSQFLARHDVLFLSHWLTGDHHRLDVSLDGFVGHRAYDTRQLRNDLDRFVFLLGGGRASYQSAWTTAPLCSVTTVALAIHAKATPEDISGQFIVSCQCLAMPAGDS